MAAFSSRGPAGDCSQARHQRPRRADPGRPHADPGDRRRGPPGRVLPGHRRHLDVVAPRRRLRRRCWPQHPRWTPGQIRSALMTTATTDLVKEDEETPADPFDMGAGRIDLAAADPGLTLDEPTGGLPRGRRSHRSASTSTCRRSTRRSCRVRSPRPGPSPTPPAAGCATAPGDSTRRRPDHRQPRVFQRRAGWSGRVEHPDRRHQARRRSVRRPDHPGQHRGAAGSAPAGRLPSRTGPSDAGHQLHTDGRHAGSANHVDLHRDGHQHRGSDHRDAHLHPQQPVATDIADLVRDERRRTGTARPPHHAHLRRPADRRPGWRPVGGTRNAGRLPAAGRARHPRHGGR